jgi:hypothetical protein
MQKIISFIYNLLIGRYILTKEAGKDNPNIFLTLICVLFFPKSKKFVDGFLEIVGGARKKHYFTPDEVVEFLSKNKTIFLDESLLGMLVRTTLPYDNYGLFYAISNLKIKISRDIAIKILDKIFLDYGYYLSDNSWGYKEELMTFNFCIPYLKFSDMENLLNGMLKNSERIFPKNSEGAKMLGSSKIGPGLVEPIKYLSRAVFRKDTLEKCADYMFLAGDAYNYLKNSHEIVALYLEVNTPSALEKTGMLGNSFLIFGSEEHTALGKYLSFLVEDSISPSLKAGFIGKY